MGTSVPSSNLRRTWRAALALLLSLGLLVPALPAVAGSHQTLWWNDNGDSFKTFGPNASVTIHQGTATAGTCDFIYPATDIYVVSESSLGADAQLTDVSNPEGLPNTVQLASGGLFISETIAYTAPGGNLGPGTYGVVYDECQNGRFDAGVDKLFYPAIEVVIPVDIPPADPRIAQIKARAQQQADSWNYLVEAVDAIELLLEIKGYLECAAGGVASCAMSLITDHLKSTLEKALMDAFGLTDPKEAAKDAVLDTISHYGGIAADPPDPDFQQPSPLQPHEPIDDPDPDPLAAAVATLGSAARNEAALAESLLRSMERYQGADAAGDGTWALVHARAMTSTAGLFSDQLAVTDAALVNFADALQTDARDLDGANAGARAERDRIEASGFTADETRQLLGLGLDASGIADLREDITGRPHLPFEVAVVLDDIAHARTSLAATRTALDELATDMADVVAHLEGQDLIADTVPVAHAGGPYTAAEGASVTLDASGSTDADGSIVASAWDVDGDGDFDDATGTSPTVTVPRAVDGLVGVQVTDDAGLVSVAYARLTVTDANRPPVLDAADPAGTAVTVEVGASRTFSITPRDPDGDPTTTRWLVDLEEAATGRSFAFTPDADDIGVHLLRAEVSDGLPAGGATTRDWTVSVLAPDADGDGWRANVDCDDADGGVNPGQHEVVGNGKDDDCDPATGDAGTAPTAAFEVSPPTPVIGEEVTFTDDSSDPDGPLTAWAWDLGDGSTSSDRHPTHTYASPGTYEVTLTVTDSQGDTTSHTISLRVGARPTAEFTVSPDPPTVGDEVTFTDTSTDLDGTITSWSWDLGDGTTSTDRHPTHTYATAASYTVELAVTDDDGLTHTRSRVVRVAGPPTAAFGVAGGLNVARASDGAVVHGFSSVYGGSTSYRADNAIDDSAGTFWYTASGTDQWLTLGLVPGGPHVIDRLVVRGAPDGPRNVELQVSTTGTDDDDFATVVSGQVTNQARDHEFTFAPTQAAHARVRIHDGWYTSRIRVSHIGIHERDRVGGLVSLSEGPPATADAASTYSTSFPASSAIDRSASSSWRTASGQTTDQTLTVDLGGEQVHRIDRVRLRSATSSYAPREFEILVSDTDADPGSFRSVLVATGAASTALQEFTFPATDARHAKLRVLNNHGGCCVSVAQFEVLDELGTNVADGGGVGATILGASSGTTAGNLIDYSAATTWTTLSGNNVDQHVDVALIPGRPHRIDRIQIQAPNSTTAPRNIEVLAGPSFAALQPVVSAALPRDGLAHWLKFDPVDATVVRLRVLDNHGATNVQVGDLRVFSAKQGGATIAFDDRSSDPEDAITSWAWDFGDGQTSSERYPAHAFPGPGVYEVTLTVTDEDGLSDTTTSEYRVLHPPDADFDWSPLEPTEGQSVTLSDRSGDRDGTIQSRVWSFDHTAARPTGATYSTRFPDDGAWPVTLDVTDSQLLTDRAKETIPVVNAPPTATAAPASQSVYWGRAMANTSTVDDLGTQDRRSLVCDWDLGDGTTRRITACNSHNVRVAHAYADPGTYTAELTVADKDGASVVDELEVTVERRPTMVSAHAVPGSARRGQVDVVARVWDRVGWTPLAGAPITLSIGGETATVVADSWGIARARLPLPTAGGTLEATFPGSSHYGPGADSDQVDPFDTRPPGDIVFVIDESGSMGDDQAAVRANVASIAEQLGAHVDFQMGLVGFGAGGDHDADFIGGGHLHLPFTNDLADIRGALSELVISGGYEPGYQALKIAMGDATGYREGAGVCAVLIGDESANQGLHVVDQAQARAELDARDAALFAIVDPTAGVGYTQLAEQTGGASFDIRAFRDDPKPVLDALVETCVADIVQRPDLDVTIDDGTDAVAAGTSTTYRIDVGNTGLRTAPDAELTSALPAGASFVSASEGGTFADGVVTWQLGDVTDGSTLTRTLTVRYHEDLVDGSSLTVPVTVGFDESAAGRDLTPANNEAVDTNTVERRLLPPIADDQTVTSDEDTPVPVTLTGGSPAGDPLTFSVVDAPTHGTLSGTAPDLHYSPDPDWHGTDVFTFRTQADGLESALATVTIEVRPVNDAPTVSLGPAGPIDEGGTAAELVAVAHDIDGDELTFSWASDAGTLLGEAHRAHLTADDGPAEITVGVTVSDGQATDDDQQVVVVRNVVPTVVAGHDPVGFWGLPVAFDAAVSDPSSVDVAAGILTAWSFGDGEEAAGASPTHVYVNPGDYEVEVTATDKDGGVGRDAVTARIAARPTTLTYTGDQVAPFGFVDLTAVLTDDVDANTSALAGREVVFTIGDAHYRAVADAEGVVTVDEPVLVPPGEHDVTLRFAGDLHYLASGDDTTLLVDNTTGLVTGGGLQPDGASNAGFNVQSDGMHVHGELQFAAWPHDLHVHDMTALGIDADRTEAWFAGTAVDGSAIVVHVVDAGEPGAADEFRLWRDGELMTGDGPLRRGNIQIHWPPASEGASGGATPI